VMSTMYPSLVMHGCILQLFLGQQYRPHTVDEVAHQDEVIKTLKMSIDQGNLPHLLFHGPPGTGKTTTILALARALYGPELYRSRILELNASDDRGISVVREKIKVFAQAAVGGGVKTPGYPCPRYHCVNIVIVVQIQ
jgi:replication factor C subunit 2/4